MDEADVGEEHDAELKRPAKRARGGATIEEKLGQQTIGTSQ